jgi:DNA-binding LacI/PurR family transcriptional regulator
MTSSLKLPKRPEAKYQIVADQFRERILRGDLRPGDRLPSLMEMSEIYELSRTTVERVHQLLELDGLVFREQGRGTFVARRRRDTGFIGVSGYGFKENPRLTYWTHILEGMQSCSKDNRHSLSLLDPDSFSNWDRVSGVVIADGALMSHEALGALPADLPRVSILGESREHASVVPDDYHGGRMATEHLLDLGHRRIACLLDVENYPTDRRFSGYLDALKSAGIVFDPRWVRPYSDNVARYPDFVERGKNVMREWLSQDWHELGCTALLLQNDMVALGVMRVLAENNISVPGQVSLVGFDDMELCGLVTPSLTTVRVPLREIGWTATDLLFREIETGQRREGVIVLPVSLQRRQSTAPPLA